MTSAGVKGERLREAFAKALDVSVNSIAEPDLTECFGDLKQSLGGSIQKSFVNMISKSEFRMEEVFGEITQKYGVADFLSAGTPAVINVSAAASANNKSSLGSSNKNNSSNKDHNAHDSEVDDKPERAMQAMMIALKRAEIEELTRGIRALEQEIKKSKDIAGRLRTQLLNEVEALNEENLKIKHAAQNI